ncbi:rod shape-determining protein RodA [Sphingomicrobium aestuariivivum]|uniref:rod shape-determining protein RodA n=1 Tax=Sphingomicrobium aestuariivivum TaxID=1582356 RepID=UPI001FD683F8|nr:rod shape-determining protein RodA [Sphingomicrobium aestuariivivum]MCJ8189732.1 rod shape-determining protein RodA [Sphingomicrobium aestuariivivum]
MMLSSIIPQPLARLPWGLITLVFLIGGFGIAHLYSSAGGSLQPWALRQGIIFIFMFGVALGVSYVPESWIKGLTPVAYIVILAMLLAVEFFGFVGMGAQRWIDLGFMKLQPSEFMKPVLVLMLARFYELLPAGDVRRWRAIWPAAILIGMPAALTLIQPDLGTALALGFGGIVVMFLAGLPWWLFAGGLAAIAAALPVAIGFLEEYQQRRILIFLNPDADPLGAGYNLTQSKIAIGSGGLWGKGYMQGSQSHLEYLPEGHTDFAFSAIVEEWGLAGGVVLILAFAGVILWGMRVARRGRTRFSQLGAAGLTVTLFFYCAINLMMVMGMAPVVGIPLPLVSNGGSVVMTTMLMIGILIAFDRQSKQADRRRQSAFGG